MAAAIHPAYDPDWSYAEHRQAGDLTENRATLG